MCGILFSNLKKTSERGFRDALNLMNHRGPDFTGYFSFYGYYLGHNRLKIIDLNDRSNQPMTSQCGRYEIVFNGEIYNYVELRGRLQVEPVTNGDTEILLELYAEHGPDCLQWLNGMFAFIIFDKIEHSVFAARDRTGVKPLYFHTSGDTVAFASEISPILQLTGISSHDPIGVRQYLKLRSFFNGRTIYEGISMFPAGHYWLDGRLHKYWSCPIHQDTPPTDEELEALINDAVKLRLRSDVPVGAYLSGGLDSSILVSLAGRPLNTWSVGFEDSNEFYWADLVARHFDCDHKNISVTRNQFVEDLEWMVKKRKEPLSVPNEVLLYQLNFLVREKNKVCLSGEGADELFFGYDRIFKWANQSVRFDLNEFSNMYSYGSHSDIEIVEDALSPFLYLKTPIKIVSQFFQQAHLHGLLRRLDSSSMLNSVEARVPFCDHHPLIERISGVSFDYLHENGLSKAPLKKIFRKLLPCSILERKKVGFPVPIESMPFRKKFIGTAMDSWLKFNMFILEGN